MTAKQGDLIPPSPPVATLATAAPLEAVVGAPTITRIIEKAIERGAGVETLERLVALQERLMARQAAMEFAVAFAAFQAECPPIVRRSVAEVKGRNGGTFTYRYAELDEIARTVNPILTKHGLSYTWDVELYNEGAALRSICTLEHVGGHTKKATFAAPTKAVTNAMSPQQEVAAAATYCKRQSLTEVLGLTTADPDTDGADGPNGNGHEKITREQVEVLEDLVSRRTVPDARANMLKWLGVSSMEEIPARRFVELRDDLKRKLEAQK